MLYSRSTTRNTIAEHEKKNLHGEFSSYISAAIKWVQSPSAVVAVIIKKHKNSQKIFLSRGSGSACEWKQWQNNKFMRKFLKVSLSLKSCSAHRRYAFAMWMEVKTIKMEMFAGWTASAGGASMKRCAGRREEEEPQEVALHNNFGFQR